MTASASSSSESMTDSPLWLTPDVPNGARSLGEGVSATGMRPDGSKAQVGLQNQARMWPTASTSTGGPDMIRRDTGRPNSTLTTAVSLWPTPDSSVFNDGEEPDTFLNRQQRQKAKGINGNGMGLTLAMASKVWPTPAARDFKGANSAEHLEKSSGSLHLDQLPNFVEHLWSTPRASDGEKGGPNQSFGAGGHPLAAQAFSLPVHTTVKTGKPCSTERRSLNPLFVEWLMGWPPGWTLLVSSDFGCSSTALSRFKLHMRCALSHLASHDEAPPAQLALFG